MSQKLLFFVSFASPIQESKSVFIFLTIQCRLMTETKPHRLQCAALYQCCVLNSKIKGSHTFALHGCVTL